MDVGRSVQPDFHPSVTKLDGILDVLTMRGPMPYWKTSAIPPARMSSNTDRFRPDAADGASLDGLSFPQQEFMREAVAVQQHQAAPAAMHERRDACLAGDGKTL